MKTRGVCAGVVLMAVYGLAVLGPRGAQSAYSGDCRNPHGNDCTYYRQCVESAIPCFSHHDNYAIGYGEKFCGRYSAAYNSFSAEGKAWINAVRRCLQVKLADYIRQNPRPGCSALKTHAFATHVPCYVNPGYRAPSFCNLSVLDLARVVQTIKSSLTSDLLNTVKAGLKTLVGCASRITGL